MECPTCQRSITIPEGGVNAIPQNLHLGFEVEVAGYMSKIGSDGEKSCDACIDGSTGPAVVFCCTCHHLLCKACHDYHKRNKILCHHRIVGLDKVSLKILPSIMKPAEHLCSQPHHEKEEFTLYCETCQLLTCKECLHKDHRINEMCNITKVHSEAMREVLVWAQDVASKVAKAVDANDKMAEQVETSRKKATLIIEQAIEQLHQTIEERKKSLLSDVESISLSKTTALTLQKEEWMKMQDEIGRYTEMTSHILQTYTDHEMVALGDLLPTELKATLKKVENVSLTPNDSSDIHVFLQTESLIKELSIFGHVMDSSPSPSQSTWSSEFVAKVKGMYCVKVETMTSKRERYPHGGLQVKAELRPESLDEADVPGEVEDHGDGTYTITLTPQTAGPNQLLITMDGQCVLKSPYDLDVRLRDYNNLCNPKEIINGYGNPYGIAIHGSGEIFVAFWVGTRSDYIGVYDKDGKCKRTIGNGGYGAGQFSYPRGLFIKEDVMYVADSGNHRIQKWTTGGQFLQSFGHNGSDQGMFSQPTSVVVDEMDWLIVADSGNNRVAVLDEDGTWLFILNVTNVPVPVSADTYYLHTFRPLSLALDPQGNIHVADCGSASTIRVFTPEGTYVRSYGDVKSPSGIFIDEEGYSLVNDQICNCLSIFDPQGNKVHTVGNLFEPQGVVLDPKSGSLYIANSGVKSYNVFKFCILK